MRRRWQTFLGAALLILFCWCIHPVLAQESQQEGGQGPKAVFKELMFDFGDVKEGDIAEHTFVVANKGDQTLEIKDVKPG